MIKLFQCINTKTRIIICHFPLLQISSFKLFCVTELPWQPLLNLHFLPSSTTHTQASLLCNFAIVVTLTFCAVINGCSMHASAVQGSTLGASRMDSSYVVLSKNNRSQGLGSPPRPRSAAAPHIEPNQPPKPIEASYIMLPPPAASIYKTSSSEGVGRQLLPPSVNSSSSMPGNNSGFLSSVTVLKRAFEIATSQTQVLLLV